MQASPSQLVFGRDMILPMKYTADWAAIRTQRQNKINRNNGQENHCRAVHEYNIGDKLLLDKPGINPKMLAPRTGPHIVQEVYNNGTLKIQREHNTE